MTREVVIGYQLAAVVAAEPLLRRLAGSLRPARVVPVQEGVALLPMTGQLAEEVTTGGPGTEGFHQLPPGFDRRLAEWSAEGPVAYVEADFFGGRGTQCAQVWSGGSVVLGPLRLGAGEPFTCPGSPISQALRKLGVRAGAHFDEFDAAGLGRCRSTEDWLELIES